jgi:ribonucleoside-diphosphate reductase alpha chain
LNYTDEQYAEVESVINHALDFKCAHYELHQLRLKYALRNKTTGEEYESSQFVYMRMAMALAEQSPKEVRMQDVAKWYEHLSHKRLNAPTPNFVNLGTELDGYASCCLYTTKDSVASLACGDHIALMMTAMSAGIGSHIKTRSIGDSVRNGLIEHQGKLGYYRSTIGAIGANLQNGRGGAASIFYTAYDPEVSMIQKLKNPMTPDSKRARGADYAFMFNKFFARKVAKNEEVALFSYKDAPDLYEAMFSKDGSLFEKLYNQFLVSDNKRTMVNARSVAVGALNEGIETGRHYLANMEAINQHTPFKEQINSSNLC